MTVRPAQHRGGAAPTPHPTNDAPTGRAELVSMILALGIPLAVIAAVRESWSP